MLSDPGKSVPALLQKEAGGFSALEPATRFFAVEIAALRAWRLGAG